MTRLLAALGALLVLSACGGGSPDHAQLLVIRNPGLLMLPRVDRAITDHRMVDRLAGDIQNLQVIPPGTPYFCPVDYGTTYRLDFSRPGEAAWTATVAALGCQHIQLSDGRELRTDGSTFFADLGAALGMSQYELHPRPCPPETPDGTCYQEIHS